MAKKIIWSNKAQNDLKQILHYWTVRNKSKSYSSKLHSLFQAAVELIAKHPAIGASTDFNYVRSKVVYHFQVFYKDTEDTVFILAIWDSRQDPEKLARRFS